MKIKLPISIAGVLALMMMSAACSQVPMPSQTPSVEKKEPAMLNQTVPGSYIVTASGDGDAVIKRVFAQYGVVLVIPLGNEQFELRLHGDPGLDALKSLAARSDGAVITIQPNFAYHSN